MEWPHWSVYLVLVAAWLWQNIVHEASHLIAIWKYEGKKPRGLYPYLHWHKGRLYASRCAHEPYKLPGDSRVHSAPLVGASIQTLVLLSVVFPLLWILDVSEAEAKWYCLVLLACPFADVLWWYRGLAWGTRDSDGKRYTASLGYEDKGGQLGR
jgi:hypothetical protein